MILAGKPSHTTPRGVLTSVAILERMAERSARPLELTADAAFLELGRVTYYAILPPAGCAS